MIEALSKKRGLEDDNNLSSSSKVEEQLSSTSTKRLHTTLPCTSEEIETLRTLLQAKDAEIATLRRELEQWRQCFSENNTVAALPPDPERVKREWKELQENDEKLKNQLTEIKLRESALIIRLSQREQDVLDLTVPFFPFLSFHIISSNSV
jgi:predicted RNase H-like nuclease (RuvC/YqgF family)